MVLILCMNQFDVWLMCQACDKSVAALLIAVVRRRTKGKWEAITLTVVSTEAAAAVEVVANNEPICDKEPSSGRGGTRDTQTIRGSLMKWIR